MNKILTNIKAAAEKITDAFDDILDTILPYKRYFLRLGSKNFLNYYHERIHKVSFWLLFLTLPILIQTVLAGIITISSFFADLNNIYFFHALFCTLFLLIGTIAIYAHKISGMLLLCLGFQQGIQLDIFPIGFVCLLPIFIILCQLRRLEYYASISVNIMQSKINAETQEQELDHLLSTYSVEFDNYMHKSELHQSRKP
ncbi:MAG: hypothetical protein SPF70_09105 [Lachnospiraceae bacterium]|nr:hypothetical protein [Lachnospiraceae bacterium]